MKKSILGLCLGLGLAFGATTTFASTPDGQTPAEETACDTFNGVAYGLCNAYCQAMDCDTGAYADDDACDAVALQFEDLTGEPLVCPDDGGQVGDGCRDQCDVEYKYSVEQCASQSTREQYFRCTVRATDRYDRCVERCSR